MMDNAIQPRCSPGMAGKNGLVEAFGENLSRTICSATEKAARDQAQGDTATSAGQICNLPDIATMDLSRNRSAQRAQRFAGA
jgi:hypothetical protein